MKRYAFDLGSLDGSKQASPGGGSGDDDASSLSQTVGDFALDPPNLQDFPSDPVMIRDFVDGAKDLKVPQAWLATGGEKSPRSSSSASTSTPGRSSSPPRVGFRERKSAIQNTMGVPKSRAAMINSAIRLYKSVHSNADENDVKDVIEEVLQWGQVLVSGEVNSDAALMQQLAQHDNQVQALNGSLEDKSAALTQMESTIGMLNKYVRQLEARLHSAGVSLTADEEEEEAFDGKAYDASAGAGSSAPPRPQRKPPSLPSVEVPTTPLSTQTAMFDTPAVSPSGKAESLDFLSAYDAKLPQNARAVYERIVAAGEKCARAHGAVEVTKNHLQLKRAMEQTAERRSSTKGSRAYLLQAKDDLKKAEAEAAKAANDAAASRRLFVMLAARLANVSSRKEAADLQMIDKDIAEAMRNLPPPGALSRNQSPTAKKTTPVRKGKLAVMAPGGVDVSKLQKIAKSQERSNANATDTDSEVSADSGTSPESAEERREGDARAQARKSLTPGTSPTRKRASIHHQADAFTGSNAGVQVIIEMYRFAQKEEIDLDKEQARLDVNGDGTLDLDDMMECCELLGHKLPKKKAAALFDHLYKMEKATSMVNSTQPEELISLNHFVDTLREKPPALSHWHSRAIGSVALQESKGKRKSVGLLTVNHEAERHGAGSHVVMVRQNSALGNMATDPNTGNSRVVHEFKQSLKNGWNNDFSGHLTEKLHRKQKNTKGFGNIFEQLNHHHKGGFDPELRRSSISVNGAHDLNTSVGTHTERTLMKIAVYCKRYDVHIWDAFARYDQFGDGFIEEADLKGALNDLGLAITVAESKLVYNSFVRPEVKKEHGRIKIQDLHDGICKYVLSDDKQDSALRSKDVEAETGGDSS